MYSWRKKSVQTFPNRLLIVEHTVIQQRQRDKWKITWGAVIFFTDTVYVGTQKNKTIQTFFFFFNVWSAWRTFSMRNFCRWAEKRKILENDPQFLFFFVFFFLHNTRTRDKSPNHIGNLMIQRDRKKKQKMRSAGS